MTDFMRRYGSVTGGRDFTV